MLKWTPRILLLLLVLLLGAAPAAAGSFYRWVSSDGTISFTDEAKRIPKAYRASAELIHTTDLQSYDRYTPRRTSTADHAGRLVERLARLRDLNQEAAPAPATHPAAPSGELTEIEVDGQTVLRVPTSGGDEGPLVVEQVRVRPRGRLSTHHNTVIRRGDEIVAVVRGAHDHEAGPSDFIEEEELFDR